jgi:hypothetical protein
MEVNIWPWSTIRRLRDALADAKHEATLWEAAYDRAWSQAEAARERNTEFLENNFALRAQLAEAAKNDTRDPKTGRFVKAER